MIEHAAARCTRLLAALALLALQGCAGTEPMVSISPGSLNPIGALSVIPESPGSGSTSGPTIGGGAAIGAGVGGVGGAAVGLASCTPFLAGGPLYAICALSSAMSGAVAGGMIGGGNDSAARDAFVSEMEAILARLPRQAALADRLRVEVLQRGRAATPLQLLDLGAARASLVMERSLIPGPQNGTLAVRIDEIRVDAVDSRRIRFSVNVQSELAGRRAGDLSRTHRYSYSGEPISRDMPRAEVVAAAERSIQVGIREAARDAVEAQLAR